MFINRRTFRVKVGCMDEAVSLVNAERERTSVPGDILVAYFGPFDDLVLDMRFDSLQAYEQFWDGWVGQPESNAFFERWLTLVEPGGKNELWEVR